jgi:micrococcal nuclease
MQQPYIESMVRSTIGVALALCGIPLSCAAQHPAARPGSQCEVSRISDGDSFRCRDGRRVRLTGIDSPESRQQPFGDRSRTALTTLIPAGTTVGLEFDVAPTDRHGRWLAYVWAGSLLVNEVMVRDGWAVLFTVPPNVKYAERIQAAQTEAREQRAGLWAVSGFDCLPSDFRRKRCVN